jgi:hypothetical protein
MISHRRRHSRRLSDRIRILFDSRKTKATRTNKWHENIILVFLLSTFTFSSLRKRKIFKTNFCRFSVHSSVRSELGDCFGAFSFFSFSLVSFFLSSFSFRAFQAENIIEHSQTGKPKMKKKEIETYRITDRQTENRT